MISAKQFTRINWDLSASPLDWSDSCRELTGVGLESEDTFGDATEDG